MKTFYKGNIHTHTTKSDGDEDPTKVTEWYKAHGYDFLVLTDHNHRTILDYGNQTETPETPLMIPGEEVTISIQNNDVAVPIHINGIGIERVIEPIEVDGVVSTIQANIDSIKAAGGIASINHPNYKWAYTISDLVQVNGATAIEVFNGHAGSNGYGGKTRHSSEQIWDGILSSGKLIYGVATDDSHHYHDFTPKMANPGRGWICVQADSLSETSIMESIKKGDFYASTGVYLDQLDCSDKSLNITIATNEDDPLKLTEYVTSITGYEGELLYETDDLNINFELPINSSYMRATIKSSGGFKAWTQPIFQS